ncbi:MAG: efflux RND transporter periplasmic adaptor subunit [Bacteroidales bacterium]|nr:efflux RND transporter periplasmic adaptor subunit [Bacteroidales bacterium]
MKKFFKILIVVVFIGAIFGTMYFLYTKSKKKPVVYETKVPFVTNVVKKTVATGSIVPRKEIEIKPRVSGIIEEIYIEAGDYVKTGDLIAKVKIVPDMERLTAAESRLNRAKINYEQAKIEYDRQKKVYDEGVIPEADFQRYRLEFRTAGEELDAAEDNLQLIKEGVTKKLGQVTNTLIRSTISGMVLAVPVEEGNSVIETNNFNAGTTIASVADMGDMIFKGKVDETEVGKIKTGMDLILSIGAVEDEKFDAKLEYIAPKGVEENGAIQFEIKANVKLSKNNFIRAGYSANADIVLERKDSVLVIPESLLKFEEKSDSAYVEVETQPQVFEKRFVSTGLSDGINIEILSGVTEKDKLKAGKAETGKKKENENEG